DVLWVRAHDRGLLDLPEGALRSGRPVVPAGAARLGRCVLSLAWNQRRAEDDGHHRRAARREPGPLLRSLLAVPLHAPAEPEGGPDLDHPFGARGDRAGDADGRLADRADDGHPDHEAETVLRVLRRDGWS